MITLHERRRGKGRCLTKLGGLTSRINAAKGVRNGEKGGYFVAESPLITRIASWTVVMNCAGKIMVEFFSTEISAMVCRVRNWSATGCALMISAASPSFTAA